MDSMSEDRSRTELLVKLFGVVFLLLGAAWVGLGLWLEDILIILAGGLAAAAGIVLMGIAPRVEESPGNS